ncbi:hypothetical protein [Primorskyibacter flagellatus]|uniref:Uncharacterized protein n=1 Tax=Primorskyibacter flagellatus TaxID=1387277 RepID=A0A1W2EQ99_9RHOB|nr:hypothetical protein [Primorskyibacter flagellatus]SMD11702.1 hypothetical protein SAMN06295998_13611 [Primorskyibacter flagellatus]
MTNSADEPVGPRPTIFVEKQTYRMRRIMDAARLVPLLGVVLFAIPLLWPRGPDMGIMTSRTILYLFGVWVVLILVTMRLSYVLRSLPPADRSTDRGGAL